jgi:hypothetical protein
MAENKRRAQRVPCACEVVCILTDGMAIASSRLSDLSTDGAFVESVNQLPVGTALRLRFQVGARAIDVGGRIVQSMPQFGFGVRFTEIAPADRATIAELVAHSA